MSVRVSVYWTCTRKGATDSYPCLRYSSSKFGAAATQRKVPSGHCHAKPESARPSRERESGHDDDNKNNNKRGHMSARCASATLKPSSALGAIGQIRLSPGQGFSTRRTAAASASAVPIVTFASSLHAAHIPRPHCAP